MVLTERNGSLDGLTEDRATVTRICTDDLVFGDENNTSCGSNIAGEILLAKRCIQRQECCGQTFLEIFLLLKLDHQLLLEILLYERCHLLAAMAIEYTEQHPVIVFTKGDFLANVSVLHGTAPALHAARAPAHLLVLASFYLFFFYLCV